MLKMFFRLAFALCLFTTTRLHGQVVINEIMYRPGTGYPENTGREFIELHNPTGAAVNLGGWAVTSGFDFTFPTGTTIAPGGYLVIAANPALVQTAYGISGVLGPWAAGTGLANAGEKITISKPGAVAGTFEKVDSVTYASEGDWATRVVETTFNGWDWFTSANGGNKSMELRNPALSNDNGQNWSPSLGAAGATPGAANSVLTANAAPIIHGVKHSPAVPKPTDRVSISCDVTDEAAPQFLSVTLNWRVATVLGAFQTLPMTLNPLTGKFSASLAPLNHLAIVEFYVSANDGVNTRTWPAATSAGQTANCQYQVTDEVLGANEAYYFMVLTGAENAAYNTLATNNPGSDRVFNQTLIVSTGKDTTIRYRSGMRIRGNSSRSYQFKPLRVTIPNDDPWDGFTNFNLNPRSSYLQFMGMRLLQAAGVRAPDSIPVKPRRNGVEYTTSISGSPDFGRWVREEDVNGDMVNAHWPEAKGGGIYKKVRPDWYWRNGVAAPANPDGTIDGWLKQNNSAANDWTDLTGFFAGVQSVTAPHFPGAPANNSASSSGNSTTGNGNWNSTPFTAGEITTLETVADLDQWARWFAVMTIFQDFETNISNGQDDDYAMYFAPNALGQRRANLVTHDMDNILGLGESTVAYNATGLYDMTDTSFVFRPLLPLLGTTTIAGNAAFRAKYHAALRDLFGTVFNADTTASANPPFYQFVDSHLAGWAPAATITAMKEFVRQRRLHLLGLIGFGATTPPPATSIATLANTPGTLMIYEVLAANIAAHPNGAGFPDVIELFNASAATIQLAGMSLTDDPLAKSKYVFPAGTSIAPGGWLVVYADSDFAAPGLHTGFALDPDGDRVLLYGLVPNGQPLLDSIVFGLQIADFSIGRTGAARDVWALCTPAIGGENTAVATLAAPGGLRINEWAGNGDYLLDEDFLEVFNPAPQPVAMGRMTLTDDFINYPAKFALPALSFIGPTGFVRFRAKGAGASEGTASELPFGIDANFGWLALLGQNGTIVDRVDVVAQAADASRGRSPNGGAAIATFGLPASLPSPGTSNVTPSASVLALMNGLRISELLYRPNNLEFIELHNIGASTLDLSGVRLVKGVTYTFPAGATLAAGAYLVVCKDRAAFTGQYGGAVPLADGIFSGSLDNVGETIALQPPAPWDVNILNFAYSAAWYPDTDNNFSLTVINDAATPARDWREQSTWSPSPAAFGTPGAPSPPSIVSPLAVSAELGVPFSYQIVGTKTPTSYTATPLPPDLTVNTATGLISGTPTTVGTTNVALSATNVTGTGTRTLVITIITAPPPTITSAGSVTGTAGSPFTYQIVATRSPVSYAASGLPAGLGLNTTTGLISGTPMEAGVFTTTLDATNAAGTGSKTVTFTIVLPPAPVITSAGAASGVPGDAFNYQIIATNAPASFGADGLPDGLTLNTASGLISGSPTVLGSFSVTLSATNLGGTGTKALTLTSATSGPLATLVWSTVPAAQFAGIPFASTLTAKDAQGRTVTSYNAPATLTAGAGRPPAIIGTGTGTWEWPLAAFYHDARTQTIYLASELGAAGKITALALDVVSVPGQILNVWTLRVKPTALSSYSSNAWEATGWTTAYQANQTISTTGLVNFVFTTPINYNGTSNLMIDFSFNNTAYTTDGFVRTTDIAANRSLFYRTDSEFGNPLLWTGAANPTPTAIARIPNLRVTFEFTPVSIAPSVTGGFVNGVWSGNVTLGQAAAGITLKADDGAGHVASSNTFTTTNPPAPVITSPANAIAVVGQPTSYQILTSNPAASYAAANLPANLTLNAGTGLISGTPAAGGTFDITLSATNLTGTGNRALSLQVQADADADGMGDAWETANGLNPALNDSAADLDGDGQSNLAEWLAGTTPNSPGSHLAITSQHAIGADIVLTWSSEIGKRYRVFARPALDSGAWSEITTTPITAIGASASFTDLAGANGAQRFYRVSVEP